MIDGGTEISQSLVPSVKVSHVRALLGELKKSGDWLTRKTLAGLMGDSTPAWERKVRAIASVAAPQVVSYPGSPGYKHFSACSEEEVEHCINALRAQGSDMIKRANLYQHALNQRNTHTGPVQESLSL